jgi:hypothetical protein
MRNGSFRRGQYSDAVLNELESQNDTQLEGMSAKVKMLKDVSFLSPAFALWWDINILYSFFFFR